MAIELSDTLSNPFSEIGAALGSESSPSVVGVAGVPYMLDTSPNYAGEGRWSQEAVQVVQQRNTTSNRDLLLLPQDVWRQMFESWHQGAGQTNLDRDDALPFRFLDSYGVDPWEKYRLSLLHETAMVMPVQEPGWPTFLQPHGVDLAVVERGRVTWIGVGSEEHLIDAGSAISVTYDGEFVWVLCDEGQVYKCNPAGNTLVAITAPAAPAVPNPVADATFIAYVKDYLLLGVGNQLWNITDPAKSVLIYTSPVVGFTWKGATDGNSAIYLVGGSGDRTYIHRVSVAQDGTKLDPAVVAATLPDGEQGVSIGSYLGFVFVGSNLGVRMASVSTAAGDLTLGALIPTARPVRGFEGQDRFVWFTTDEIESTLGVADEGFPDGPVPGLSRMDLTTFTVTQGTPAYASDLVAPAVSGEVQSVVTWQGVRVFSINGVGVFMEQSSLMEQGWVAHGAVSFGVEDLKTGLYEQAKWQPLAGGEIGLRVAYDSVRYTSLGDYREKQSIRSGNASMQGQQFSRINVGFILKRDPDDTHAGPVLTRWEIRAIAVKGMATRWNLPLMNYDQIELNGVVQNRDVNTVKRALLKLAQSGSAFTLEESGEAHLVTAVDYKWVPEKLSLDGRGWQGVFMLVCEELK